MSYNPDITAARRAAKRLSREQGVSYQAMLDMLARHAGRSDWDAYLADPVPVQLHREDEATKDQAKAAEALAGNAATPAPSERSAGLGGRMVACLLAIAAFLVCVPALAYRLVGDETSARETMLAVETDRIKSTTVRFAGSDRDMPVTSLVRSSGTVEMTLMVIDDRIFPISQRRETHHVGRSSGGRTAAMSMIDHPVVRFAGRVDCRSWTYMPYRLETADSYRGAARYSHALSPRRGVWQMTRSDADRICATPGQGEVTERVSRA